MKIISIFILLLLNIAPAFASEITGKISTDPNNPGGHNAAPVDNQESQQSGRMNEERGGGSALILQNRKSVQVNPEDSAGEIKVLGIGYYPDGSLLRGPDKKIYLIKNGYRKYISNLQELKKYAGREIIDAGNTDLNQYLDRPHLDGELIGQIGDAKVYVIDNGAIRHIKSLGELRAHYFGLEIFNLKPEEMKLYS